MSRVLAALVIFLAGYYTGLAYVPEPPQPLLPPAVRKLKCPDPSYEERRLLKECQEFVLACIVKVSRAAEGLSECRDQIGHQEDQIDSLRHTH